MLQAALAPKKICLTCKSEFGGGEVFCPIDGGRLTTQSQSQIDRPTDPADPLIGVTLAGRYQVTRRIGEGGMGIVYEARHVIIQKRLAVKLLRDDCSSRPDVVERFRQEARSASLIGHEHIVDISDFGETPTGQSYFVMEMLEGEDLANTLARDGTIAVRRALEIALQCAKALGAAHSKGIVHRDMKPENIFLTRREGNLDFVKIVDFGIAKMSDIETAGDPGRKLTKTGMIFGTPEYMSPEQAAGKPLDHRVDIYAMGVILFEMLTGRVPFVGDTFLSILTQHSFEPPPSMLDINPDCEATRGIESIIKKALQKDAKVRYQTMDELAGDLTRERDALEEVTAVGLRGPVRSFSRRLTLNSLRGDTEELARQSWMKPRLSRGWVIGLMSFALAGLAGGGYWWVLRSKSDAGSTARASAANSAASPKVGASLQDKATTPASAGVKVALEANNEMTNSVAVEAPGALVPQTNALVRPNALVGVVVSTEPLGGRVVVEGRGTVCEGDPCRFLTPSGRTIRLHAQLGKAVAHRVLLPSEPENIVQLELAAPSDTRRSKRRPAQPPLVARPTETPATARNERPATAEEPPVQRSKRQVGELKVPDIFR